MNLTQNPATNPSVFSEKANDWFAAYGMPKFTDIYEAIGLVQATDDLVDSYVRKLEEEQLPLSEELILHFGSAVSEAFSTIFTGEWYFSPEQARWVILAFLPMGTSIEINIFNKLEKRFMNGKEDSIQYMYDMIKKMYLEEAETLEASDGKDT